MSSMATGASARATGRTGPARRRAPPRSRRRRARRGGPPGALGRVAEQQRHRPARLSASPTVSAAPDSSRARAIAAQFAMSGPCTMAQSSRAASNGLWPPFLTSEPPMKAIPARRKTGRAHRAYRRDRCPCRGDRLAGGAPGDAQASRVQHLGDRRAAHRWRGARIVKRPDGRARSGCARRRFPLRPDGCWLRARPPGADLPAQAREAAGSRRAARRGLQSPTLAPTRAEPANRSACTSSWARQSAKVRRPAPHQSWQRAPARQRSRGEPRV